MATEVSAKLQKQIESRRKEAEDKDICSKANAIAKYLGKTIENINTPKLDHQEHEFENERFKIHHVFIFEDYGDGGVCSFGTTIRYRGRKVFDEGGATLNTFIPGKWEKEFNELFEKTQVAEKKRRRAEARKKRKEQKQVDEEERKRWGL